MYVCVCNAVTEKAVRECVAGGCCSLDELAMELGVGTGCGRCRECATDLMREAQGAPTALSPACA